MYMLMLFSRSCQLVVSKKYDKISFVILRQSRSTECRYFNHVKFRSADLLHAELLDEIKQAEIR